MKEKVMDILMDLRPDVDFENEKKLIGDGILESFDIMSLVAELEDEFDVKIKPKHLDTIVATKKLQIEGMSCVNCQNRIENALNGMAQVNAKASFKKGEAIVKLGADVPEEELCEAVEKLGYKVTSIELM